MENLSKMKKNRILGALSIELVEKGNNQSNRYANRCILFRKRWRSW